MFDKIERDRSFVSWVIQLLIAYSVPVITLAITLSYLPDTPDTVLNQLIEYLFVAGVASALALLVSAIATDSFAEGVLIWIVPAGLEFIAVVWGLSSDGLVSTLHGLFLVPGPGQGEGSWGVVILTQPAWGCCWYSAIMWWRLRTKQRNASESRVSDV
jgi:hypothetical protein